MTSNRRRWKRSDDEIADVLDTALTKIAASAIVPLTEHDYEWVKAIRYWLEGFSDEEAVARVRQERAT